MFKKKKTPEEKYVREFGTGYLIEKRGSYAIPLFEKQYWCESFVGYDESEAYFANPQKFDKIVTGREGIEYFAYFPVDENGKQIKK